LCAVDSIGADQPSAPSTSQATPQAVRQAEILHHALEVRLVPDRHELLAVDQMAVKALADGVQEATFTLHGHLQVVLVVEQRPAGAQPVSVQAAPATGSPGTGQVVTIRLNRPLNRDETVQLMWQYRGAINEPPREPRHLRFVTPSETAGHIGIEGAYLSGETLWYPDLPGSLPPFTVRVKTPGEWTAVTHGRQRARMVQDAVAVADWEVADKTEALTLVANRFVAKQRDWPDPSGRPIEVAAYLFPDEAQLADEYLDASIRYLDAYSKILGPYPFPKFAVVENFFASGLGMPSFTLLGSAEIKRRYVQHDRLGHEVVHSWIGNSVFNEAGQGNWVEGLTTYLANYYYEELTGTPEQAREQRRKMLLGYAVYVRPEEDYPVAQFTQKKDQKDNAIGYQKAAMVFHMLRREIGEESFWRGLRTLVARYRSRHAGWKAVEQVFAEMAGRELRWFFAQWVEQPGAPALAITQTAGRVRLMQGPRAYRVRVPLSVSLADGQEQSTSMQLTDAEGDPSIPSGARSVRLDPDYHVFRRIAREALPPMLNLFVTDRNRAVVMAGGGTETDRAPYVELAKQIAAREPGITSLDDREVRSATGSMLVLGGPGVNRAAEQAVLGCGNRVSLGGNSFTIEGKTYDGPGMALLVSCRDSDNPGRQATLFYGLSPQAAATVSRLLFFYGWQSYLVFQDGSVVARGDFPPRVNDLEVTLGAQ
ncbi:MAG TPA: M1 family aminopeptidase, partial [Nitrospiraceae bacterium]|nr:M1 family aminopeptidase [Nitrospiraceae bacterium]